MLIDTGGLLAALFPDQRLHDACAAALLRTDGPRTLSPFVLGELDYLIGKLAGVEAQLALLEEVARGAYEQHFRVLSREYPMRLLPADSV